MRFVFVKPFRFVLAILFLTMAIGHQPYAQLPVNNPCLKSNLSKTHWTVLIKWKSIVSARNVAGLIDVNNTIDSAIYVATAQSLSRKGGGILYFPPGTYAVNFSLPLYDGVLIRGADAEKFSDTDSLVYPSKLLFPRLVLNKENNPATDSTICYRPRYIYNASGHAKLAGLINLEVNRASIILDGEEQSRLAQGAYPADAAYIDHVLLYGIKQNNAAMLDEAVPSVAQLGYRQGWQIWPDKNIANINIAFRQHCSIINCMLNTSNTDDILQNDFIVNDGMKFDGTLAQFKFADHTGIKVLGVPKEQITGIVVPVLEVNGNEVIVTANNEFLSAQAIQPILGKNNMSFASGPENLVIKGLYTRQQPYDLFFKDSVPSELITYYSPHGDTLPYRLIKPKDYDPAKKYPLVVYLHDFWDKGNDGKRQLRQFIWQLAIAENREKYPCFIIAPQLPDAEPRWKPVSGLGSETWPLQCTANIIEEISSRFTVDTNRVYAIGNSMGGSGVIHLVVKYPEKFAAVIPISAFYRFTENASAQLAPVPVWLIFGEKDERVSRVTRQAMRQDLKSAHVSVKYTEVPAMGHRCWNYITTMLPDFLPWLFSQQKAGNNIASVR